jgi:hypothetical protein
VVVLETFTRVHSHRLEYFCNLFLGTCRGKEVAIKKLHQQELEEELLEDFRREVEIMT